MTKEEFRTYLKGLPLETIETIIEACFYSTTLNRFGAYKMDKFDEMLCDDGCMAVVKAVLNSPGFTEKLRSQMDEIIDEMIYSASDIVYDLEVEQPELADKFYEYVKSNI